MYVFDPNSKKLSKNVYSQNKTFLFLFKAYVRFLKIRGTPEEVAKGFALGVFIGMSPFMGLQTPVAILLAALLGWNKISSALGVWITNPITAPFIYSVHYYIGAKILGKKAGVFSLGEEFFSFSEIFSKTPGIIYILLLGGLVTGLILILPSYFVSLFFITKYREKVKNKTNRKPPPIL